MTLTMTSLRELLALETARLEAERTREIEHAQALAREAQRAREASERLAAEALEARERDARARREREKRPVESGASASSRRASALNTKASSHAIDVALAAERAEIHAKALQVAAKERVLCAVRSPRCSSRSSLSAEASRGSLLAWTRRFALRTSGRKSRRSRRALRERKHGCRPRDSSSAAVVQAPVAPALAQPANARPARPRPNWRSNASTNTHTTTTNDPFSQLSNIDRGAGPINGTDR